MAPTTGLVAEMVRQFADPYAFLRELVQNAIDAGATRIEVRLARDPDGSVATSVDDDGCGMTLEVIERQLLTLFSSSKEGDAGKIGKYGVGFISVLALDPDEVQVDTRKGGHAWFARIHRDHRYAIEEAPPRPGSGTVVTLIGQMDRKAFAQHLAHARASLRRWCRHAERPITLRAVDRGGEGHAIEERIDRPIEVWGPIAVNATIEGDVIVVGLSAGSAHLPEPPAEAVSTIEREPTFAGFYSGGLTLFETADEVHPSLAGVRFKVVSRSLSHTLSRDNVRRDAAFAQVIDRVRGLARGPLRRALAKELERAASAAAAGDAARYAALLEAAIRPPIELSPREIPFPLAHPTGGRGTATDLRAPLLADRPCAITEALACAGKPVVLAGHASIAVNVRACFPKLVIEEARSAYLLASELAPSGESEAADRALFAEVRRAIAAAGEEIAGVGLASIDGAYANRAAVAIPDEPTRAPRLSSTKEIDDAWTRWSGRLRLLLNVASPVVIAARAIAASDPRVAGQLLARRLLVEGRGPIDPKDADRLLALLGGAS